MIKKIYPHTILQAIALISISLVCCVPILAPVLFFEKQIGHDISNIICFLGVMLMAVGITIFINRKNKVPVRFNFGPVKPKLLFLSIPIILLFQLAISPMITWAYVYFFNFKDGVSNLSLPLLFGMLLAGSILEELLFRGIILKGFLSNYGPKMAIFSCAVLFAIIHGNIIQSTQAFFFGGFLSYIYFKERSLTMPALLHFFANLTAGVVMYWKSKHQGVTIDQLYGPFTIHLHILATILFFFTIWWFLKKAIHQKFHSYLTTLPVLSTFTLNGDI